MGATLVTGGTGFLGSHLVRALAERGDDLRLLIRTKTSADHLEPIKFERANGEITDRRAVRRAMAGAERVFHVAGTTSLRSGDARRVFETNVRGARTVLEEALEAEVDRAVLTSSVAAIGPAEPGTAADETQEFKAGHLGIPYVNSKHEAEVEALRLAVRGLPVVCVNPAFAFGPDDPYGTSMGLIRRFLLRRIPAYVGGALNVVDVRDVAAGHLLADERGAIGERYILGGRNFTLDRLFADLSRISGVPAPPVKLPGEVVLRAVQVAARLHLPVPTTPDEVRSGSLWWTYSSAKAKRELGFRPRPHEETLEQAVEWQASVLGDRVGGSPGPELAALDALGRTLRIGGRLVGR